MHAYRWTCIYSWIFGILGSGLGFENLGFGILGLGLGLGNLGFGILGLGEGGCRAWRQRCFFLNELR